MSRLLVAVAVLFSTTAHAAPPGLPEPMTEVADIGVLCTKLRGGLAATATCKQASKLAVKGIGEVEVWTASDTSVVYHAVSITNGRKRWLSERVEVELHDCSVIGQCDEADRYVPRAPRALATSTPMVAVEFPIEKHRDRKVDGRVQWQPDLRWSETQIVACQIIEGAPYCVAKSWGEPNNSCRVTLSNTGGISAVCNVTDDVMF